MSRTGWMLPTVAAIVLATNGCAKPGVAPDAHEPEPWAVTSWGERYEIFAEAAPLVSGEISKSHTHVTVLAGFTALADGVVSAVLTDSTGKSATFVQKQALRAGIFSVEIKPEAEGIYDLVFRVESAAGTEAIPSGRVRVGSRVEPGGLVAPPAPPAAALGAAPASDGDPISFLKEQQWRTPFATEWATVGSLNTSVGGPARIRPAAGGEAVLAAPLDGVVVPSSRFHVGLAVGKGGTVVELRPRAGAGRSFEEIGSESRLANERLLRIEELFTADAVSRAELDRARARATTLAAELDAVRGTGRTVPIRAPFGGRIAEIMVTPGEAVASGTSLARLVRMDPLWVELSLRPEIAAGLNVLPTGLIIQSGAGQTPLVFGPKRVKLVSRSPEVDRTTGLVQAVIEVSGAEGLSVGTAVQAELLLPGKRSGIVIPAGAIVDDAGVPVVYVQPEGESFTRREVRILARQGERVLVEGVSVTDRVVTQGAAAIRRSAQMSSGEVEGHVH